MKTQRALLFVALSLCVCIGFAKAPKYVFYFIGDGMSLNHVLGTQYFLSQQKGKPGVAPLGFTAFPYTGLATTFSASSDVTDSAAGGTALACGEKTVNGSLGLGANQVTKVKSIAEMAKEQGKRVGIATSVTLNHATPASFYAHQKSRNDYYEIGVELTQSGFNFFGGGDFEENVNHDDKKAPELYKLAEQADYRLIRGYDKFQKNHRGDKVILIQEKGAAEKTIPYAIDAKPTDLTLAQITAAGIEVLDNRKGFFFMVEGGKIDYAAHANDAATVFQEVIDFDKAISVAYEFYKKHPKETLIVITADHETGGLTLGNGSYALNFAALHAQKASHVGFSRVINRLRHDNKDKVSWEQVREALKTYFGFWDTIELKEYDEQALYSEYQNSIANNNKVRMAKSLYYMDEPISALAVRILDRIAMVSWPVGSHTAAYAPVFAIGNGAEQFCGQMDNTEIPVKIATIAEYNKVKK